VNAGFARPVAQQLVIPLGPIRFYVNRAAKRKIVPRLDVVSSITAAVLVARPGERMAWRESLSSGAIVLLEPETSDEIGTTSSGIVSISDQLADGEFPPLQSKRTVMSHELIHAAQYDFEFNAWSVPIRGALDKKYPGLARYMRYVDVNLMTPVDLLANSMLSYRERPWEREAISLAGHAR
jgi:hypothetical protein